MLWWSQRTDNKGADVARIQSWRPASVEPLAGGDFRCASLSRKVLTSADLRNANLTRATLHKANLERAVLTGVGAGIAARVLLVLERIGDRVGCGAVQRGEVDRHSVVAAGRDVKRNP